MDSAIEIKPFAVKDLRKAGHMAAEGMHYNEYVSSTFAADLYGYYAILGELVRSTHLFGAYQNGELLGFMFVAKEGDKCPYEHSRFSAELKAFNLLSHFISDFAGEERYLEACETLKNSLSQKPDIEVTYLAIVPKAHGKGIGTLLMNNLHTIFAGEQAFLYTDNQCNYGYYDHVGFTCEGHTAVAITKQAELNCMIYTKQL